MQLDDVMGTATAVAGRVGEQSRIFENIGNKVLAVGAKFPAINGIINAVRRKKSKVCLATIQLHSLCQCLSSVGSHQLNWSTRCRTPSFWPQSSQFVQYLFSSTGSVSTDTANSQHHELWTGFNVSIDAS